MKRLLPLILAAAALVISPSSLKAQQKRISPHETISGAVSGDRIMIVYGRPYTKDPKTGEMRKIWGGLVPYGKVWRAGADEATILITQKPIVVGGTTVAAGAYTLWVLPNADGTAKLIVNKEIGQWGTKNHEGDASRNPEMDVAQVDMAKASLEKSVDQFTISLDKTGAIVMKWETTQFSAPFLVVK